MSVVSDRLTTLQRELEDYQPVSGKWGLDLDRPLRSIEAGLPEAAVTFVGRTTERILKRLWEHYGVAGQSAAKALNELIRGVREYLNSPAVLEAIKDIQMLRNRSAHDGYDVSEEDAYLAIRRLLVLLDWVRTSQSGLIQEDVRVSRDVEERAGFLAGLYAVLDYRLAKRFDLTTSTTYLLLERSRGLRLDYVEIAIGSRASELRTVLRETGGRVISTDLPTTSRFLVVDELEESPPEEAAVLETVVRYSDFLRQLIDLPRVESMQLALARRNVGRLSGTVLRMDTRSNEYQLGEAFDASKWLRQRLVDGENVVLVGAPCSGKSALLKSLLDPEWSEGPTIRFLVDLRDRSPGESLCDAICRQVGPLMKVDRRFVYDVFLYVIRAGRALCLVDSLDESLGVSSPSDMAESFVELCELFSAQSRTVLASRSPALVDSPWLRQLLHRDALLSEQLRTDVARGGVDPTLLPPFSVLRLDGARSAVTPAVASPRDGLISLLPTATGPDAETASAALNEILRLIDGALNANQQEVDGYIGESAFRGTARFPVADLIGRFGAELLQSLPADSERRGVIVLAPDGSVEFGHSALAEAVAARWYVHTISAESRSLPGERLSSELVRRFIHLLTPDEARTTADGYLWRGPAIVGPSTELHLAAIGVPLRIDLRLVTVGEYRAFLDVADSLPAGLFHPEMPHLGSLEPMRERVRPGVYRDSQFDGLPAVAVSWWGAFAYARWRNGRLPSSIEWEIAARGRDARLFPWGEDAGVHTANCADHWAGEPLINYTQWKQAMDAGRLGYGAASADGEFPLSVSACGAHDMGGNVWEWTETFVGPVKAVIAGGSYDNPLRALRASSRGVARLDERSNAIGFRVMYED